MSSSNFACIIIFMLYLLWFAPCRTTLILHLTFFSPATRMFPHLHNVSYRCFVLINKLLMKAAGVAHSDCSWHDAKRLVTRRRTCFYMTPQISTVGPRTSVPNWNRTINRLHSQYLLSTVQNDLCVNKILKSYHVRPCRIITISSAFLSTASEISEYHDVVTDMPTIQSGH